MSAPVPTAGAAGESLGAAGAAGEGGSTPADGVGGAAAEAGHPASEGGATGGEVPSSAGAETGGVAGEAGAASSSAGAPAMAAPPPPSCVGPTSKACGPHQNDDCCTSLPVPGGTFLRQYDGVVATNPRWPATVSDFVLDKYEVTVDRFRKFVDAWSAGYRPDVGSGKHEHLPGGGIFNELGWEAPFNELIPSTKEEWDPLLNCYPDYGMAMWSPEASDHETKPINCVTWHEAYAFCIYDGGFLPTQAESNYASAGGDEQRLYPWSSPAQSLLATPSHAAYGCRYNGTFLGTLADCEVTNIPSVGSRSPKGDGRWGHADLGGSVGELLLDVTNGQLPTAACVNCAQLLGGAGYEDAATHYARGGSFVNSAVELQVAKQGFAVLSNYRHPEVGIRCARSPQAETENP